MDKWKSEEGLSDAKIERLEKERIERFEKYGINEDDILDTARKCMQLWEDAHGENRRRGHEDVNFLTVDQWTPTDREAFRRLGKPALTFNKIEDPIRKIEGEYRRNKIDPKIRSLTGKASQEEINLREDIFRTICYESQTKLVFQTAFSNALAYGYSAFRIGIEFESPHSFNKVIRYHSIKNVANTFFDPRAELPHKGDGDFAGYYVEYSKEEFHAEFPEIRFPISWGKQTEDDFRWITKDTVIVADLFIKEWYSTTIYRLSNGQDVTEKEWTLLKKQYIEQQKLLENTEIAQSIIQKEMPYIVMERESKDYRLMHYRLIKDRIIDFEELEGKYLPVFFVPGNVRNVNGNDYTKSFIHDAIDAQKFINYVGTEIASEIKNRRREQWIATPDNVSEHLWMWQNPEQQQGALIAKPDPLTKQMPNKLPPSDVPQTLMENFQRGSNDVKEILGFSESNLGQPSNENSGIAIENRQLAGSLTATIYFDNLAQAIAQSGRAILELMPLVFKENNRYMILTKSDGDTNSVLLNQQNTDGSVSNTLSQDSFDIEISSGPSFGVQKQQAIETLVQLAGINPQVFSLSADIIGKNLDLQFAPQLTERLKTLVPEEVLAKEEGTQPPPPQPDPQSQMMQQEMQIKAQEIQLKEEKLKLEKQELMLKSQNMQQENKMKQLGHATAIHDSKVNQETEIMKILADLQKEDIKIRQNSLIKKNS